MPSDDPILPSDVEEDDGSGSESQNIQEEAPELNAKHATSHFEVMMGKPIWGAILDAETRELKAQVPKRKSRSITEVCREEDIWGDMLYFTEKADGEEVEIDFTIPEPESTDPSRKQENQGEKLEQARSRIRELESKVSRLKEKKDESAKVKDLRDQVENFREECSDLREEKRKVRSRKQDLREELQKAKNDLINEKATLRQEKEDLRAEKDRLERRVERAETRAEKAEDREDEMQETIDELRDRNDRLKRQSVQVGEGDESSKGFWEMLGERLMDGPLDNIEEKLPQIIQRIQAATQGQQPQRVPQQVTPHGGQRGQRQNGRPQAQRQNGQAQTRRRSQGQGSAQRPNGAAGSPAGDGAPPQPQTTPSGGGGSSRPGGGSGGEGGPEGGGEQPRSNSEQPQNDTMSRDEAVGDLFARIIEDSAGRLTGEFGEAQTQEHADLIGGRLQAYREEGVTLQLKEWAQLLIELTATTRNVDLGERPGLQFCHQLWPILEVFSDELTVVQSLDASMAANTMVNAYQELPEDQMLLGEKLEVTERDVETLTSVIEVIEQALQSGERPGGQPAEGSRGGQTQGAPSAEGGAPESGRTGGGQGRDPYAPGNGPNDRPPGA